ncbi:MAG: hypothetical protein ACP5O1_08890 [Phycisphaerae bacterium]
MSAEQKNSAAARLGHLWRLAAAAALLAGALQAGCQSGGVGGQALNNGSVMPSGLSSAALRRIAARKLDVEPTTDGIGQKGFLLSVGPYRIFTDIKNPIQQRLIMRVLKHALRRFESLLPSAHPRPPLKGYIFAHRRQWAIFTRKMMPNVAPYAIKPVVYGYDRKGVFALHRTSVAEMLSVLAHEAWLQFSYVSLKDHLPAWMDEGLAAQFEAVCWRHGKPKFIAPLNYPRWLALRAVCQAGDFIPLHIFTRMDAGAAVTTGPQMTEIYYAQLWSLMLFITHHDGWGIMKRALRSSEMGRLTPVMLKAGLSEYDLAHETTRWNMVAGPIYFHHFISPHPRQFAAQYRAFARRLAAHWPPKLSH